MSAWFAIALGGATGAVLRHAVGLWVQRGIPDFPWGTFVINVTGSFALGFLAKATGAPDGNAALRAGLTIGLCGGYTTFSTFSFDTVALLESGGGRLAALNVVASVTLALLATFAGIGLGRLLLGAQR